MQKRLKSTHKKYKKKEGQSIYKEFEDQSKLEKETAKKSFRESMSERFKLPSDMLAGAPIIISTGRHHLTIENYKGIIEYTGSLIKVQTKTCKICIEGKRLNIDYFTNDEMRISGTIETISYQ